MGQEELFAPMEKELRRGTLVLCVLCQLEWPMYGYSLVGALPKKGVPVEANTLYPLLRRLEGQGLCLKQLSAECMVVTGRVEKMEFLQ